MLFMKGIGLWTNLPIWLRKLLVFSGAVTLLLTFCPRFIVMLLDCRSVDSVKALVLFHSMIKGESFSARMVKKCGAALMIKCLGAAAFVYTEAFNR
ncbi:hypothetical protein CISIN_1g042836mg [Citrus sinensis]|uniref:Uncharacterized protein n=1 Tax=Citrus sinensis TaxID=2711 RepID=A0A067DLG0_CITSI|nr:hypothetical protein CISIN_1g042836mg [Citrus sinensis]